MPKPVILGVEGGAAKLMCKAEAEIDFVGVLGKLGIKPDSRKAYGAAVGNMLTNILIMIGLQWNIKRIIFNLNE
jgi:hypothetical protein